MQQGESRITNMVLKMLGEETKNNINNYVNEVCSRNFTIMQNIDQVKDTFSTSSENFLNDLTEDELLNLRSYTGYHFWNINAILRNNWNYEVNGALTSEKINTYTELSNSVSNILDRFHSPSINFMTFRGTTIDSFSNYGITDISELITLKDKYIYEQGFTSTSILQDSSYFNKTLDDGRFCNVGIRYLIPAENSDGALLINDDMSYSTNQNEFLLNKGSLSKVVDVKIENNIAVLTVVLVPKKVYDINYNMGNNEVEVAKKI